MSGQITREQFSCFRIGDPTGSHPIFDATGSTLHPGRWNTAANAIIYASIRYSTSLLEKLAYSSGVMPPNQHYIEITIPAGLSYEVFDPHAAASRGWDDATPSVSKVDGDSWARSARSLLLIVPSVIVRIEDNVLINPKHSQFTQIRPALFNKPVHWDKRLFGTVSASP